LEEGIKNVKILGDRVLLQQLPRERKDGSFWLPEDRQPEQQVHRVLQLGTSCTVPLKLGDLVLVDQYSVNSRTFVEEGPAGSSLWILATEHLSLLVGYEYCPTGYAPI
jgi:co-chaperonin GroES (HSP10)